MRRGGGLLTFFPWKGGGGLLEREAEEGIYSNFKKRRYYSLISLVLAPKTYRHLVSVIKKYRM